MDLGPKLYILHPFYSFIERAGIHALLSSDLHSVKTSKQGCTVFERQDNNLSSSSQANHHPD